MGKVLIIQDYCPTQAMGMAQNSLGLAEAMIKIGTDVSIASPDTKINRILNNVPVIKIENLAGLETLIKESSAIIPVCNFTSTNKPLAIAVIKLCEESCVPCFPWINTTLKNASFNTLAGVSDFNQELYIKELLDKLELPICKKLICVSNAVKKSMVNCGLSNDKLVVILNSINPEKWVGFKGSKLCEKSTDVLFVGRLSPEKGVLFFISSIKLLKSAFPDLRILIVGEGFEVNIAKSLIKILELERQIKIVDKMENGELLNQIRKSRVLVNTSLTESFGIVIIEAMACSVPVVVPNTEGPAEIIQNGKFGEVFEIGNTQQISEKISRCLIFDTKIQAKTKAAKEFVLKNLTTNIQAEKFVKIIGNY